MSNSKAGKSFGERRIGDPPPERGLDSLSPARKQEVVDGAAAAIAAARGSGVNPLAMPSLLDPDDFPEPEPVRTDAPAPQEPERSAPELPPEPDPQDPGAGWGTDAPPPQEPEFTQPPLMPGERPARPDDYDPPTEPPPGETVIEDGWNPDTAAGLDEPTPDEPAWMEPEPAQQSLAAEAAQPHDGEVAMPSGRIGSIGSGDGPLTGDIVEVPPTPITLTDEHRDRPPNPVGPEPATPPKPPESTGPRVANEQGEQHSLEAAIAEEARGEQTDKPDAVLATALDPQLALATGDTIVKVKPPTLTDKFIVPSFTTLDTRAGYWQERRRRWLSLGVRGETTAEHDYAPHGVKGAPSGSYLPSSAVSAEKRAKGEQVGGLKAGASNAQKGAFNPGHSMVGGEDGPGLKADEQYRERKGSEKDYVGGRQQGLIYDHNAPASDPAFYDKMRDEEAKLTKERVDALLDAWRAEGGKPGGEAEALGWTDQEWITWTKTHTAPEASRVKLSVEEFRDRYYKRDEQEFGDSESIKTGTSVFDPVLCEIAYRWFSNVGGQVLDPFAGGAVRGVIAAALSRKYTGIELRPEQLLDNQRQGHTLFGPEAQFNFGRETPMPQWIEGDATQTRNLPLPAADLVFSCPPYADLERYSDDPRDLSNMPYEVFRAMHASAIAQAAERLKDNRFFVWVIGEARDKKTGLEYGVVPDTLIAARAAGLGIYNQAVLINSVGSGALRAQRIARSRKLTRLHQNFLVFVKGDPKKAAEACGTMEVDA
jgi:hypothetical protein